MTIVIFILACLIAILVVFFLASIITLCSNWKYYKPIYNQLKVENFVKASDNYYNQVCSKDSSIIIWFANENTFKLNNHCCYLHNTLYTFVDPYSCYWWFKYKKWFETNCNHLKA